MALYNEAFLKAPTGSGKSYLTMKHALYEACVHHKRCVIAACTHTIAEQMEELLLAMKNTENYNGVQFKDFPCEIVLHTSRYKKEDDQLQQLFRNSNFVLVTLHPYIRVNAKA